MVMEYKTFEDWFHEQGLYSLRSEYFFSEIQPNVDLKHTDGLIEWLKAAFSAGREGLLNPDSNSI